MSFRGFAASTGPGRYLLSRSATAGALAGGLNGWLCYIGWPRPVSAYPDFAWHIVPAGAVHGALLALIASLGVLCLYRAPWRFLIPASIAVGWLAGYASWQPLRMSLDRRIQWSSWPFAEGWPDSFISPLASFGLVASIFCLVFIWARSARPELRLLAAVAAGVVGSLWWWIGYEQWYLSPLHGTLWGVAVGASTWNMAHVLSAVTPATNRGKDFHSRVA